MKSINRSVASVLIGMAGLMHAAFDCAAQEAPSTMLPLARIDRCGVRIVPFIRDSRIVIELQYGVSWDARTFDRLRGTTGFAELQLEYCVKNSRSEVVWKNRRHVYVDPFAVPDSALPFHAGLIKRSLAPDNYSVICRLIDLETGGSLRRTRRFTCPDLSNPSLYVSDIMLASSVSRHRPGASPAFVKGDCSVCPYPFEMVSKSRPVYLYFEIAHLCILEKSSARYTVRYDLEQTGRGIHLLSRAGTAIGSEYTVVSAEMEAQEFFALDLTAVECGRYRVTVTVTDEVADRAKGAAVAFRVVD